MRNFVNLHAHTNLGSMLDALIGVDDLFGKIAELGQKAVAITDHGTLASHLDAFNAYKRTGIKFIPGLEMYYVNSYDLLTNDDNSKRKVAKSERRKHLVLLAQNQIGYKNLLRINYTGFQHSIITVGRIFPRINWSDLSNYTDGIICTSACANGPISQLIIEERFDKAAEIAQCFAKLFPDRFYIEIHPHLLKDNKIDQDFINRKLINIANKYGIPLVAAIDTHYATKFVEKYHDVLLAINSKAAIDDPTRHRYGIDEFYVKSGDEVYDFLCKHYGEEVAEEAVNNTVKIAEMCELPDYMEVKGNHLPVFKVSDTSDYNEFLKWREKSRLKNKPEDIAYMRFKCIESFNKKFYNISKEESKYRWERVKKELKILEGNNFSSYMLVVSDFIKWAKENNILVGIGRGCTTKETLVLTEFGLKNINNINVGEKVYTHNGILKSVIDKFEYDVDEDGIEIKTQYSFGSLKFTRDHKLLVVKKVKTKEGELFEKNGTHKNYIHYIRGEKAEWIKVSNIEVGDYLFTPIINRNTYITDIDLSQFAPNDYKISDNYIEKKYYKNRTISNLSISKATFISPKTIANYKKSNKYNKNIESFLNENNISYENWSSENDSIRYNRYISSNEDTYYIIGRWIGDGFIKEDYKTHSYYIGFSCNSNDKLGIQRIVNYFKSLGFVVKSYKKKENCLEICIYDKILVNLFKGLFPEYKNSYTKYLGNFRILPDNLLLSLIHGLVDSDGYIRGNTKEIITSSDRMIQELREVFMYLKIPSSIYFRQSEGRKNSYSICFDTLSNVRSRNIVENGFCSKVLSLNKVHLNKVYDISVDGDMSYITQNYASHNSVGGSMVAYLLDIHGVDPIEYGLLFERFQNAHKKDLPDIDTDFTSAGRDLVKTYCKQKYGMENCAQVSNINTYTPKNVIPDLVKTMRNVIPGLISAGQNYVNVSDEIKKAIPELDENKKKVKTLQEAMRLSPKLREFSASCPELMEYADAIIGLPKEYSTHAAGMVISDIPIIEFAPLRIDKNNEIAVQYEKNRCESLGLIKMDFLAVSTLDIIDETLKNIRRLGFDGPNSMKEIPLDDEETYKMIQQGHTKCVFQLGKSGMMVSLCKLIKPKSIIDIAIINALGRPSSSNEERKEYAERRFGKKEVKYLHSSLENSLKETYGLGIFEEQLMGVAQDVAGWDLNKADGLRKLTKLKGKNPKLALQLEVDFIEGTMKKHEVSYEKAKELWDKVVLPFLDYGFNKCLEEYNFLLTPDGFKKLMDISIGDNILSLSKDEIINTKVKDIGKTDRKMPVYEIIFDNRVPIRTTMNHKLLTPFGMKEVQEIIEKGLPVRRVESKNLNWLDTHPDKDNYLSIIKDRNNMSIDKLSKKYDISRSKINTILNGKKPNRKHSFVNKFNNGICDEETAYWFGFICADGHVDEYRIDITLANYDFTHLQKFASFIGDSNPFYSFKNGNNKCITYIISNKEIARKLIELGIPSNKDRNDINIDNVPEYLFRHFLRGYFDGDGSFAVFNYKGKRINFGIKGHSNVLNKIKQHLNDNINNLSNVQINDAIWFRSLKDVKRIADYIYNNSFIFLSRKRIKFERFLNNNPKDNPKLFKSEISNNFTNIKSVEYIGLRDTYFIEVDDENHNYILNDGIVSANSHAVFYSINGYITAYLKYHYPASFLAAYLKIKTVRGGLIKDEEITMAKNECRRMGINIIPPDINKSSGGYEILDKNTIVMGFSAIKGMGEKAIEEIISKQPFSSLVDFLYRVDARIVNKSKLEALAKAGCFDSMNISRKFIHNEGKKTRDKLSLFLKRKMKDGYDSEMAITDFPLIIDSEEWSRKELLTNEQEVLNELVSGTIGELYPGFFTGYNSTSFSRLKTLPDRQNIVVEFVVKAFLREYKIKKGKHIGQPMIKYRVEDMFGTETEITVWPTEYKEAKKLMKEGRPIRAQCQVSEFNGLKTLMLKCIEKAYDM